MGTYSGPDLPIDIKITKDGNTLLAQGEGQASFPLDAIDINVFHSKEEMITLKFQPNENKMLLEQDGKSMN